MTQPYYPASSFPQAVDEITNFSPPEIPDAIMAIQKSLLAGGAFAVGSTTNGTAAGPKTWGGTGAPATGMGSVGDYYFRSDTPSTSMQRIYVKTAAAVWTGIV